MAGEVAVTVADADRGGGSGGAAALEAAGRVLNVSLKEALLASNSNGQAAATEKAIVPSSKQQQPLEEYQALKARAEHTFADFQKHAAAMQELMRVWRDLDAYYQAAEEAQSKREKVLAAKEAVLLARAQALDKREADIAPAEEASKRRVEQQRKQALAALEQEKRSWLAERKQILKQQAEQQKVAHEQQQQKQQEAAKTLDKQFEQKAEALSVAPVQAVVTDVTMEQAPQLGEPAEQKQKEHKQEVSAAEWQRAVNQIHAEVDLIKIQAAELAKVKLEQDREAQHRQEEERAAKEKQEQREKERLAKEKQEQQEKERLAKEKQEQQEKERLVKEKQEQQEKERLAKERQEQQEKERQQQEKERVAREKLELQEKERQQREEDRVAKEKLEQQAKERAAKEKQEQQEKERAKVKQENTARQESELKQKQKQEEQERAQKKRLEEERSAKYKQGEQEREERQRQFEKQQAAKQRAEQDSAAKQPQQARPQALKPVPELPLPALFTPLTSPHSQQPVRAKEAPAQSLQAELSDLIQFRRAERIPNILNRSRQAGRSMLAAVQSALLAAPTTDYERWRVVLLAVSCYVDQPCTHCTDGSDGSSIRRACLIVLQAALAVAPTVPPPPPQLLTDAEAMGKMWLKRMAKSKISLDDPLDAEVFLHLLAAFGVAQRFSSDDVFRCALIASLRKPDPGLCRAVLLNNRIPDLVRRLITQVRHCEALQFVEAFGLQEQFPPVGVLKDYMAATANDPKVELKAMRQVLRWVESHPDLTRELSPSLLQASIARLEAKAVPGQSPKKPAPKPAQGSKRPHQHASGSEYPHSRQQQQQHHQPPPPKRARGPPPGFSPPYNQPSNNWSDGNGAGGQHHHPPQQQQHAYRPTNFSPPNVEPYVPRAVPANHHAGPPPNHHVAPYHPRNPPHNNYYPPY